MQKQRIKRYSYCKYICKNSLNIFKTLLTTDLEKIMLINYAIKDLWEAVILITGCLVYLYHLDWHAGTIVVITMVLA